jgi:hypothetical protein
MRALADRSIVKRRNFVVTILAITALTVLPSTGAISSTLLGSDTRPRSLERKKLKKLKSGDICLAEPDALISLPSHPRDGDFVHIAVDGSSLNKPSIITSSKAKIVGEEESLELDSLAILKLTFNAATNNWQIG